MSAPTAADFNVGDRVRVTPTEGFDRPMWTSHEVGTVIDAVGFRVEVLLDSGQTVNTFRPEDLTRETVL